MMGKILKQINVEMLKAEAQANAAADICSKNDYKMNDYQYYQQRVEYLKGLQMAKTIIEKEIKNDKRNKS